MRILFVCHYFPPEVNAPAARTYEHCRQWVRAGHDVTVLTCFPNHPHGKLFPGYRNRLWARESIDGINVVRVLTYCAANKGRVRRSLNYLFFMVMTVAASLFASRKDVVITTSPELLNGLAGFFVSRIKGCPWVLEIRDLWPESIRAVGAIDKGALIRALEGIERFAYTSADAVVSVTDSFVAHIEGRGGAGKVRVVKNGVDLALFRDRGDGGSLAERFGIEGRFVAAYVGTHGMAHGLDVVLDAAQKLAHRRDIALLMVGDGAEKRRLQQRQRELGLDNVVMLDLQPKAMMPKIWSAADVSLVLLRKSELFKKVIPSKIFESMAMGKPIILGVEGESLSIIRDADAGIGIEPENADQLAAAICRLADDRALYQRLAANGRAYVAEHFDRRKLALDFLAILERTVAARRGRAVDSKAEIVETPSA